MTAGRALQHLVLSSPQPGTQDREEQLLTSYRELVLRRSVRARVKADGLALPNAQ
jgi:hypothetical protein